MRRTDPGDWMWAQACDLIDQAERMHRQFFRLAPPAGAQRRGSRRSTCSRTSARSSSSSRCRAWPPSACRSRTSAARWSCAASGRCRSPASRLRVRQLEIPYGAFERRIPLPPGRFEVGTPELTHGCLVLRLRKIGLDADDERRHAIRSTRPASGRRRATPATPAQATPSAQAEGGARARCPTTR